ncbi:MAG: hypothetical protein ACRCX8_13380 [Sarcina sp.]
MKYVDNYSYMGKYGPNNAIRYGGNNNNNYDIEEKKEWDIPNNSCVQKECDYEFNKYENNYEVCECHEMNNCEKKYEACNQQNICVEECDMSNCNCNETCEPVKKGCSNCGKNCTCCEGLTCDFNQSKVESIRTVVKRLFSSVDMESCPVSTEQTIINGADYTVAIELIPKSCNCECPPIDATSKFVCDCLKVVDKKISIANPPEIKINGKEITVTGTLDDCYTATLDATILACKEKCKEGEKANLCVRADGWSVDSLVFEIHGCVTTNGKKCGFIITVTLITPIAVTDNSVFYTKDLCITDGQFKLCLVPNVCITASSIIPVLDTEYIPSIDAIIGLDIVGKATIEKDQVVCIQAVIID